MNDSAGPVTRREGIAITLAAIALTVYFTWPVTLNPAGMGRLRLGDGQFSVWNVAWVAHAIITPGEKLFDANIFHPHRSTLAYSEPNIGAGLLAVPAYYFTRNPHAAHNSAMLIGLTGTVIGMYLLVRRLTGSREAALVATIVFSFCPFFFARTAHIQLMMMWPLPFALLAFHRFVEDVTLPRAAVLGVAIGVQALFCSYYGVLVGLLVGLGVLVYAVAAGLWRQPRWWYLSVLAAVVSVVTVLPFFLPYLHLQSSTGFERTLQESQTYSADWRAYFASSSWAHDWMLAYIQRWKEVLFPGFTALILGGYGMFLAFRRRPPGEAGVPLARANAVFYLLVFILALWSSFGPQAGLYSVLYYTVPVFSLLRAPARFGLAVTLALSVFAAVAVSVLLERLVPSRRWWAALALALVVVVELSTEIPYIPAREVPRAYKVLAAAERGPVVELPFYYLGENRFRQTQYMLGSTWHWQRLVNGYSDYIPPDFFVGGPLLESFPNAEGFAWLRERGTRYIVVHLGLYDGARRQRLLTRIAEHSAYLEPRHTFGTVHLYEIVAWPPSAP
jgi:hypothetical protein